VRGQSTTNKLPNRADAQNEEKEEKSHEARETGKLSKKTEGPTKYRRERGG
jgi:hypothetical protein